MTFWQARPLLLAAAVWSVPALADEAITITATKIAERADTLPLIVTPVSGDDLRARGAGDLRGALAGVAGVEVNPGGDQGPAGTVVSLQGLAEVDAYLLVVDGVPYGGAFNPATTTFDPIDVDRIEVLNGAAPVSYGATSFVGVIHAIHYDAGEQPTRLLVQGGTRSSARDSVATSLPTLGGIAQSLLADAETRDFSQDRGHFDRFHVLYRAAADTGIGRLHFDLDAQRLRQTPYSPHPVEDGGLSPRFPIDANINPTDARADRDRLQGNLGLDARIGGLDWATLVSVAKTWSHNTKGFLRADFADDGITHNADGYRQGVRTTDVYADTHIGQKSRVFDWVFGADFLYGNGRQRSSNFEYGVLPNGSNAPNSHTLHIDESTVVKDHRYFSGVYGQAIVRPVEVLTLLAGLRLNRTIETRCAGSADGDVAAPADDCQRLAKTRLAGSAGATLRLWHDGGGAIYAFANYRNTYKPAAIDFGPEAEGDLLQPETATSWEAGFKAAFGNRLTGEVSYFDTRFNNLVIAANANGFPALENAGRERFRGFEGEVRAVLAADLTVIASYARHTARFVDYARAQDDGTLEQLAGKRLILSPRDLASAVATFAPALGPQASATLRYAGSRCLDEENTVTSTGYATVDGRIGWRWRGGWGAFVDAENLTDRRDPVAASELGEGQYYRLPGRRVLVTVERRL